MKKGALAVLLFIVWIFLAWPFGSGGVDYQSLVVGAIVSILSGLMFGEGFTESPRKFFEIKRYLWAIYYLPVLLYYIFLANFDVAYRVLHPGMPIRPGIVKVKTKLKSKSGITALANSITLTPGTMTIEVDPSGYLYVHWIYVKSENIEKATEMVVRKFERILERIYE